MEALFKDYLFSKHILVNDYNRAEGQFQTAFCLAHQFGIKIVKGIDNLDISMIDYCAKQIGQNVPQPFYKGFPDSVRSLTTEQLLFDQLYHYAITYGLGDFSQPGHSVFEENFQRVAFTGKVAIKEFTVFCEEEAFEELFSLAQSMLKSTRPLNATQYEIVKTLYLQNKLGLPEKVGFDTLVNLLFDTRDIKLASYLQMSDVIKIVAIMQNINGDYYDLSEINLKNQQRKFITSLIDYFAANDKINLKDCYEKKQVWCGLLHHIHYKAKCPAAARFVSCMRNKGNKSAYSAFEKALAKGDVLGAMSILEEEKGSGALLRNINYLLSRCSDANQVDNLLNNLNSQNTIVLLQLLMQVSTEKPGPRTFTFTKFNLLKTHEEDDEEQKSRKTLLSYSTKTKLKDRILQLISKNLASKLGKVYVDPSMRRIAIPLQETTGATGLGVLPKGSRIPLEQGNTIRAFTYWEKVNDIDLSAFGMTEQGEQLEFSWRTMFNKQSDAICYSGDETSGYDGGSEYYDIEVNKFKSLYPASRYLIFANNVYSSLPFSQSICKAGYMIRSKPSSGEVFEPKTVQTSFTINAETTFAYLFAIDLHQMEMIWLNVAANRSSIVAGDTDLFFLDKYLHSTEIFSVYDLYRMAATQLVDQPALADVVVSDTYTATNEDQQIVRSYDFDKILALLNTTM